MIGTALAAVVVSVAVYLVELPNGRQGYALPEEQRSLGCVGVEQGTGECVGD